VDLEGLTATLHRVDSLHREGHGDETAHLRRECEACLNKIFDFGEKISKFRSSLQNGGSGGRVHEVKIWWHKVEWSLLREDDVKAFKLDLVTPLQRVEMEQQHLLLRLGYSMR
jgi:hypothetical protein